MSDSLLTFSIGPVHAFIGHARRIADLWAGSQILSDLARVALDVALRESAKIIFPKVTRDAIPHGLPNRFVARVPSQRADDLAKTIESAVYDRWNEIIDHGVKQLQRLRIDISGGAERHLWKDAIQCSWSWVLEEATYEASSAVAAELYAASRLYRPFSQSDEWGMKCAICGERNALPDGIRRNVMTAWQKAETNADTYAKDLTAFVRSGQTRLCLVCASKRFYPAFDRVKDRRAIFESFEAFQPEDKRPYFALVSMDGDRLGDALRTSSEERQGKISDALNRFADDLRTADSANLNLQNLGVEWPPRGEEAAKRKRPQLIYAGGEDVLFVCDPRDALRCAAAIREHYGRCFAANGFERETFTISGAVIFAHTKIPAGRLLSDAEDLLKQKAKASRNALAIALHKRSGPPVETVFPWDGDVRPERISEIANELGSAGALASGQTYYLADEHRVLTDVFTTEAQWKAWLDWRLGRGEKSREQVARLAELIAPLFTGAQRRVEALRIARFLAKEASPKQRETAPAAGGAL